MTDEPDFLARAREAYDASHRIPAARDEVDLDAIEAAEVSEVVSRNDDLPGSETTAASENLIPRDADEQMTIDPGELIPIHYKHLLDPFSVSTFQRVKHQTMQIADVARELIAELIGGTIGDGDRSQKQFLTTPLGQYRVAMSDNSDNSSETMVAERMGVEFVHLNKPEEVVALFAKHGLDGEDAYRRLTATLKARSW